MIYVINKCSAYMTIADSLEGEVDITRLKDMGCTIFKNADQFMGALMMMTGLSEEELVDTEVKVESIADISRQCDDLNVAIAVYDGYTY